MQYFLAAEKCHKQIASNAEDGSLTSRYGLVLEELRIEARRQTGRRRANQEDAGGAAPSQAEYFSPGQTGSGFGELGGLDFNVSPSDTLADMTSWEQFDSMVGSTSAQCPTRQHIDGCRLGHVGVPWVRGHVWHGGLWWCCAGDAVRSLLELGTGYGDQSQRKLIHQGLVLQGARSCESNYTSRKLEILMVNHDLFNLRLQICVSQDMVAHCGQNRISIQSKGNTKS